MSKKRIYKRLNDISDVQRYAMDPSVEKLMICPERKDLGYKIDVVYHLFYYQEEAARERV